LTPTRGGSSGGAGAGELGVGSWLSGGEFKTGAHSSNTKVTNAKPTQCAIDAHKRFKEERCEDSRCFIPLIGKCFNSCTAISIDGQKKNYRFLQKNCAAGFAISKPDLSKSHRDCKNPTPRELSTEK
jgi:hypothetical protein